MANKKESSTAAEAPAGEEPHAEPESKVRNPDYRIENWDSYFMVVATAVSRKSKDPDAMVGAVVVSPDREILTTGFNGFARRVWDLPELINAAEKDEKLAWMCHAEFNAIVNAARNGIALKGCSIYVNKFPCFGCCNAIIQAGIDRVVTSDKWYWKNDPVDGKDTDEPHSKTRRILRQAGIKVHAPFHPEYGSSKDEWDKIKDASEYL